MWLGLHLDEEVEVSDDALRTVADPRVDLVGRGAVPSVHGDAERVHAGFAALGEHPVQEAADEYAVSRDLHGVVFQIVVHDREVPGMDPDAAPSPGERGRARDLQRSAHAGEDDVQQLVGEGAEPIDAIAVHGIRLRASRVQTSDCSEFGRRI
jgi:hypothetical protein